VLLLIIPLKLEDYIVLVPNDEASVTVLNHESEGNTGSNVKMMPNFYMA
jgi:hypothetical protein